KAHLHAIPGQIGGMERDHERYPVLADAGGTLAHMAGPWKIGRRPLYSRAMVRTAPRPTAPAEDSPAHHVPTVNILAAVHVLSSRISRAFDARLAREFDVSPPEWRVLLTLAQRPGASANEITAAWAMEKMAVSRAVRRL